MLYQPLKLFIIYILITMAISFWGPIEYYNFNRIIVFLYMIVFLIFFAIAYSLGAKNGLHRESFELNDSMKKHILKIVKSSILLTLFIQIIYLTNLIIKSGGIVIRNLGEAYISVYTDYVRNTARSYSAIELLTMFTELFKQISIVLGIYYFKELNKKWRLYIVLIIFISVFSTLILQGKQKQVGDIIIFMASVFAVKYSNLKNKIKGKTKVKISVLMLLGLVLFTYVQGERYAATNINAFTYNEVAQEQIYLNTDHIIFKILGYKWGFPLSILLTSYLGGGYYGLSLCLRLPFKFTYGIGNSYALSVLANRFLGLPFVFDNTYPIRMEQETGWPALSKWHTIFPWLASDYTFFGAILYLAVISYIYATCWVEACKYKNPLSIMLFAVLTMMVIYIPANNQLMIGPQLLFAFIMLFIIWFFKHKSYNFSND